MASLEAEIGRGNTGLILWSAFSDVNEPVPELAFPNSISTYSRMRTDAQVASLLLGYTLPIRRYAWFIDPNGARDEVTEHVADNLNLPIEGKIRSRRAAVVIGSPTTGTYLTPYSWSPTGFPSSSRCIGSMRRAGGLIFASWLRVFRARSRRSKSTGMED
jgi:hypothetical protein